jgi:hypothetical protein
MEPREEEEEEEEEEEGMIKLQVIFGREAERH